MGFAGGEGKPGVPVMEMVEVAPRRSFRAVSDESKIAALVAVDGGGLMRAILRSLRPCALPQASLEHINLA